MVWHGHTHSHTFSGCPSCTLPLLRLTQSHQSKESAIFSGQDIKHDLGKFPVFKHMTFFPLASGNKGLVWLIGLQQLCQGKFTAKSQALINTHEVNWELTLLLENHLLTLLLGATVWLPPDFLHWLGTNQMNQSSDLDPTVIGGPTNDLDPIATSTSLCWLYFCVLFSLLHSSICCFLKSSCSLLVKIC